ncbi:SUMO-activating enzyme subunit 1A [Ancistrocladus abbreviatus]
MSNANLFPSQPYDDYAGGDSESDNILVSNPVDNVVCEAQGASSTIVNAGNISGVLEGNDIYLGGTDPVNLNVSTHMSGYITSNENSLPINEVENANLSCESKSNMGDSRDESSDHIEYNDPNMTAKYYVGDSDVDDDTPSYLCGNFFDCNKDRSMSLHVGLIFYDKNHFMEILTDFAVINGMDMLRLKHSKSKFIVVCNNDQVFVSTQLPSLLTCCRFLGLKALPYIVKLAKPNNIVSRTELLLASLHRLKLEMDGEELTEQETALYDRQIRVWGADAQRRLSKAHVLVCGMKGTIAEFCKNIVLAGVGSVTLLDDRMVTEEAFHANFLIPPDENIYAGRSIAEVCCDSLKDFNPMVRVSVEKDNLSSLGGDFYQKFDIIIISSCCLKTKRLINEKCRKLSKRVAFYSVDCRDSCGEIFADLQNHVYTKKKLDETVECQIQYPSYEEAIAVPWRSLPRRVSKLYFAMRVIEHFEESEGRNPGETSLADLPNILKLRKELCGAQSFSESQIPDSLLERLIAGTREFPPVCAIIGGILGQEVIKAISGKGDPLKNFFLFDAMDGKGIIEDISNPKTGS